MKAMLSQPMAGKSEEEIIATRDKAIKAMEDIAKTCLEISEYYQTYKKYFAPKKV